MDYSSSFAINQIQTAPFSLEHPTQFFIESRRIRGGETGPGVKRKGPMREVQEATAENSEFGDISAEDLEGFEDDMDIN